MECLLLDCRGIVVNVQRYLGQGEERGELDPLTRQAGRNEGPSIVLAASGVGLCSRKLGPAVLTRAPDCFDSPPRGDVDRLGRCTRRERCWEFGDRRTCC